jgi:hypothetical protein
MYCIEKNKAHDFPVEFAIVLKKMFLLNTRKARSMVVKDTMKQNTKV